MTTNCNYDCYDYEYYGKEQNFLYDDKGNLIEETFIYPDEAKFEDSRFKTKRVSRYDENNRLIEELMFNSNNEPVINNLAKATYEYFDDNSYELIYYIFTEKW